MAITKIADVIVPELFNRYVINRTMELSAFFQSGIVVNSPGFDALASEAARTHNMPFFEDLQGESEPTLEDVKMTPAKIGSNKDVWQRTGIRYTNRNSFVSLQLSIRSGSLWIWQN